MCGFELGLATIVHSGSAISAPSAVNVLACAACGGECRPVWAAIAIVLGLCAIGMLRWVVTGKERGKV